jgi:hypothetical protein
MRFGAQAATTARPKVPMRRRGADCLVVVMKDLFVFRLTWSDSPQPLASAP